MQPRRSCAWSFAVFFAAVLASALPLQDLLTISLLLTAPIRTSSWAGNSGWGQMHLNPETAGQALLLHSILGNSTTSAPLTR